MKSRADNRNADLRVGLPSIAREAQLLRAEVEQIADRIESLRDRADRPSQHARSFLKQLLKQRRERLEELGDPAD